MTDPSGPIRISPPLRFETPVLIVGPLMRVERRDDLPTGQVFLIDGETYCVNGLYPYSKAAND